jgi:uncharacterized membrane protein YkvA (DUF1232 family)
MPAPSFSAALQRLRDWARRMKRDGVALWFARRHPRTPWAARALVVFVAAYALSPIDLIPDFIPVLGLLDELVLLPALIALAIRLVPADVLAECRHEAEAWMADADRPRSRWGAALVIALWIVAAALAWHWLAGRS